MKKYDLLKVLGITFIVLIVLSWLIVPGSLASGEYVAADSRIPIGLFDLFRLPVLTIGTFFQIGIVLLVIGGFYGVINKTGVYGRIVEGCSKFSSKKFLLITMIYLIVLSSLFALTWVLFIFVPFLVAVLLKQGYNKVTALAATVGSILIGLVTSTYGFGINGYIINLLNLGVSYQIITKLVFLVVIGGFYIFFVMKYANLKQISKGKKDSKKKESKSSKKDNKKDSKKDNKKDKKEEIKSDKKEEIKSDKKEELQIPLYIEAPAKKRSVLPLIIIAILSIILLLIGLYNFYYSFGIEMFQDFHTKVIEIELGGFDIFAKILGTSNPIGYWSNYELCSILMFACLVIGLVYRLKLSEIIDGFALGAKQMLKPALYAVLANIVFTFIVTGGNGNTINDAIVNAVLSISGHFNIALSALGAAVGSIFYNDFYYLIYSVTGYYQALDLGTSKLEIVGLLYQAIYGLFMLFLPTSVALIAGLSYLNVSYKEWLKYIWKFLLALFIIIIIFIVVTMIFM